MTIQVTKVTNVRNATDPFLHQHSQHPRRARVPPEHRARSRASESTPGVRGKLPVHAGRGSGPAPPAERSVSESAGYDVPPTRRARDELLNRGGAAPSEFGGGRVQRRGRRRRRAVRPPARRRERG